MGEATTEGVRRALAEAENSVHIALDPSLLDFADHSRLLALPVHGPAEEDPADPGRVFRVRRRSTVTGGARWVRLSRETLAAGSSTESPVVDLTRLVAVLELPSGTRQLIDRAGSSVRVRTADLDDGHQLERYLAHALRRVPRLSVTAESARYQASAVERRRQCLGLVAMGVGLLILFVLALVLL